MEFVRALYFFILLYSSSVSGEPLSKCNGSVIFKKFSKDLDQYEVKYDMTLLVFPQIFDARKKWPRCKSISEVQDQKDCHGCWAYAATSVMEDRYCINTGQKENPRLSEHELLQCCVSCRIEESSDGCTGGSVEEAFHYWVQNGIRVKDKEDNEKNMCQELGKRRIFGFGWYKLQPVGQQRIYDQIRADIFQNGPVVAFIRAYPAIERLTNTTEVDLIRDEFSGTDDKKFHAIKIIGWDDSQEHNYWIIANSWGTDWCDNGFCRIRSYINELQIETQGVIGGLPRVDSHPRPPAGKTRSEEETSSSLSIFRAEIIQIYIALLLILSVSII